MCRKLDNSFALFNFLVSVLGLLQDAKNENSCQIMWPSKFVDRLAEEKFLERTQEIANVILGQDMAFDFDILISKVGVKFLLPQTVRKF